MAGEELNVSKNFAVGTSNVKVSEEQFNDVAQRKFFSITNTSLGVEKISIAFNEEAVSGNGIVLSPGGFYSESSDGINNATNKQINVICNAATGTIAYSERIINRRF